MNLPKKLSFLRKEKGLSQENLADEMNVSRQAVSKWESGNVMPSLDNLIYLSKLYGVTIDFLIDDSQNLPPEPAPPESPREEHPAFPFIRKYGWPTAFVLALIVTFILVICILRIQSQADDRTIPMQDLPTYIVGADEEYSKGTFSLDGF